MFSVVEGEGIAGERSQPRTPFVEDGRAVAEAHAELLVDVRRERRSRGALDLMIAATAKATGRLVVTAHQAAFVDLPRVQVPTHR
jgi:tRNA(fMet)-specific endonuclease VapC